MLLNSVKRFMFPVLLGISLAVTSCSPLGSHSLIESGFSPGIVLSQSHSTILVSASSIAVGQTLEVIFTPKDQNANLYTNSNLKVSFAISSETSGSAGGSQGVLGPTTQNQDGSYSALFTAVTPGSATSVSVFVNGLTLVSPAIVVTNVIGSSSSVGQVSSVNSTVQANPVTVSADGTTASLVTVRLADPSFQAVTGKQVSLISSRGSSVDTITGVSPVSNNLGQATFTVSSTSVGTATFTATDVTDTVTLSQTAQVIFSNSGASSLYSSITASGPVVADGTTSSTVSITLKDLNSNPISNLIPAFAATDTGTTNQYGLCTATDSNGHSTCLLKSTHAETKTVSLTSPVMLSGGTVVFQAGSFSNLGLSSSLNNIVSATSTNAISITEYDAHANPIISDSTSTLSATAYSSTDCTGSPVSGAITGGSATFSSGVASLPAFGVLKTSVQSVKFQTSLGSASVCAANLNVTPGAISSLVLSPPLSSTTFSATSTQSITLTEYDAQSNVVTHDSTSTLSVTAYATVDCTGSSVSGSLSGASNSFTGGIANLAAFGVLKTNVQSVKFQTSGAAATLCAGNLSITPGAISSLAVSPSLNASTVSATATQAISIAEYDAQSNGVSTDSSSTLSVTAYASVDCTGSSLSSAFTGGSATFSSGVASLPAFGVLKTNVQSVKFQTSGGSVSHCAGNLSVTPGAIASIAVSPTLSSTTFAATSTQSVTVTQYDAQSNIVTSDSSSTVSVTAYTSSNCSGSSVSSALTGASQAVSSGIATLPAFGVLKTNIQSVKFQTSGSAATLCATTLSITPGSVASLSLTPSLSSSISATSTQAVSLTEYDSELNVVTTDMTSLLTVTAYSSQNCSGTSLSSVLSGINPTTFSAGVINLGALGILSPSVQSVKFQTSAASASTCAGPLSITPGQASQVVFSTSPSSSTASSVSFSTQPIVTIEDAQGNVVTIGPDATALITLSLNPAYGTLTGTTSMTATAGVANFAGQGLAIALAGTGKVLTAVKSSTVGGTGPLSSNASQSFTIINGPASAIVFQTQPATGVSGNALSTQPIVVIQDAAGNTVTTGPDATAAITLTLTGTGTLSGTSTLTPSGGNLGVASFSGLSMNLIGSKTLTATKASTVGSGGTGMLTASSNSFMVTAGAASQLAFTTQPGGGTTGAVWTQQPVVQVQDASGNLVSTGSSSTTTVSLSLSSGSGTLLGTTSVAASSGVASFSGLNINLQGASDQLTATAIVSGSSQSVVSSPFAITLGASLATANWPFTAGSNSNYNLGGNLDLTGGVVRLTPSSQVDNNLSLFNSGTFTGAAYYDGTLLRLNSTSSNSASLRLSPSWTPYYSNIINYFTLDGPVGLINNGSTIIATVGNNGTSANSTASGMAYTAGKIGQSVYFDGTNDFITAPSNSLPTGTSPRTMAVWVYPRASHSMVVGFWGTLTQSEGNGLLIEPSANFINFYGFSNDCTATVPNLPMNQWSHIVATYDGTNQKIYFNGSLVTTCSLLWNTVTTNNFCIAIDGYNNRFYGNLDEFAVWNVALGASDVSLLYNYQSALYSGAFTSRVMNTYSTGQAWQQLSWNPTLPFGKPLPDGGVSESTTNYPSLYNSSLMSGIQGLWHLNEPAGTSGTASVIDRSGNSSPNPGTPAPSGVTFGNSGILGTSAQFSGSNSYIVVPNLGSNFTPTQVTLSAWVNANAPSGDAVGTIFSKGGAGGNYSFVLNLDNSGSMSWGWLFTTPAWHSTGGIWKRGSSMDWTMFHHVAGTYDGNDFNLIMPNGNLAIASTNLF